jgi:hypothetical protein
MCEGIFFQFSRNRKVFPVNRKLQATNAEVKATNFLVAHAGKGGFPLVHEIDAGGLVEWLNGYQNRAY